MKIVLMLLVIVTIIFFFLFVEKKVSFPVTYKVCGLGYVNCQEIARFKDRESCDTANKKWGWYCDQTDTSNIKCQEKESNTTIGFCD